MADLMQPEQMLMAGRYAAATEEIGFFEIDFDVLVDAFVRWQRAIHERYGRRLDVEVAPARLDAALERLEQPHVLMETSSLFTKTGGPWVAYFQRAFGATDVDSALMVLAARLGCRAVRMLAAPHTYDGESGEYGGLLLTVYDSDAGHRTIGLINDGGPWDFDVAGEPFEFEEIERYSARRPRDRFDFGLLRKYTSALGLQPFETDWYRPGERGTIVHARYEGGRAI